MSSVESPEALAGELGESTLGSILRRLGVDQATGVLSARGDDDIVVISFTSGRIMGANAMNEPFEAALAAILTDEGLLTPDELDSALDRAGSDGRRLRDVLLEEDLLVDGDYLSAVRRYTSVLARRCASWDRGDYVFHAGDEVAHEEGFEGIEVAEVVPLRGEAPSDGDARIEAEAPSDGGDRSEGEEPPVAAAASEVRQDFDAEPVVAADPAAGEPEPPSDTEISEPAPDLPGVVEPDPGDAEPAAPQVLPGRWLRWAVPTLIVPVLLAVVVLRPNSLVLPFFWLESERLELEKERRASVYLKIDRAAKTFFLLEGRFPDDLPTLVERGLLSEQDIVGSRGRILNYRPDDRGYVIRSAVRDGTDPGASRVEAIAGNFFLDPEFADRMPASDTVPLVLLD